MKKVVLLFLLILLCTPKTNLNASPAAAGRVMIACAAVGAVIFGPLISAGGAAEGIAGTIKAFQEKKWRDALTYFGGTAAAEAICASLSAAQLYFIHNKAPLCPKELLLLITFYHLISGGIFLIGTLSEPVNHNLPEIDASEILKKHVVPFLKEKNFYDKFRNTLQNVFIPTFLGRETS